MVEPLVCPGSAASVVHGESRIAGWYLGGRANSQDPSTSADSECYRLSFSLSERREAEHHAPVNTLMPGMWSPIVLLSNPKFCVIRPLQDGLDHSN